MLAPFRQAREKTAPVIPATAEPACRRDPQSDNLCWPAHRASGGVSTLLDMSRRSPPDTRSRRTTMLTITKKMMITAAVLSPLALVAPTTASAFGLGGFGHMGGGHFGGNM